ncbi:MAG: pilus assembly protein PilM [Trichlorobacter sp.]|uniref:type IV pilus biogenesis protein PilM n=1 Tax=Trichlorobacter sp. TaxID=2911007 RepID=UPI00256BB878|nr:pilus assembly protein PilM [Trichlorobacter sp.]MDK9716656.1 pilus assembly protein PilM [Trichlorobacter sp.]
MGLLQRKAIGIEISHGGIAAVMLSCSAGRTVLQRATRTTLPANTLQPSLKEAQVLQPAAFVASLREAWGSLNLSTRRIALSLPDNAGILLLTHLDEPWKTRDEATDVIRWKLAKRLGMDPELLQLDFQLLERRQDGSTDLMVALAHRTVIQQYEELAQEAGLQPARIGFHTLHLLRLLDRQPIETGQIITLYDNALGTVALSDAKPIFYRVKTVPPGPEQTGLLRRELAASLSAARHTYGGILPGTYHAFAAPHNGSLTALLTETRGTPPTMIALESLVDFGAELSISPHQLFQASAAIGAAVGAA